MKIVNNIESSNIFGRLQIGDLFCHKDAVFVKVAEFELQGSVGNAQCIGNNSFEYIQNCQPITSINKITVE